MERRSVFPNQDMRYANNHKWMKAGVFPGRLDNDLKGQLVTFDVRLGNLEHWPNILESEGWTRADHDNKSLSIPIRVIDAPACDVHVNLTDVRRNWEQIDLDPTVSQPIPQSHLWAGYQSAVTSGLLTRQFQLKKRTRLSNSNIFTHASHNEEVLCRVQVCQENGFAVQLPVNAVKWLNKKSPATSSTTFLIQAQNQEDHFLTTRPDLDPKMSSLQFISDSRFRRLCIIIEASNNSLQGGWKFLAHELGIRQMETIYFLEQQASIKQRQCVSADLFNYFFDIHASNQHQIGHVVDVLRQLSNILGRVNASAQHVVDDEIASRSKDTGSYTCVPGSAQVGKQNNSRSLQSQCIQSTTSLPAFTVTPSQSTAVPSPQLPSAARRQSRIPRPQNRVNMGCSTSMLKSGITKKCTTSPPRNQIKTCKQAISEFQSSNLFGTICSQSNDSGKSSSFAKVNTPRGRRRSCRKTKSKQEKFTTL